jgi:hypothetical protein
MRTYIVEILRGDVALKGEVFPGEHDDFLHAPAGQVIEVVDNDTESLLAKINLEFELVEIRAGKGLTTRVEQAMDRLGQKARYSDDELEIIVQVSQLR